MNLNRIANQAIIRVNENNDVIIRKSNGYTTASNGKRIPSYLPDETINAQLQPISSDELKQIENVNIQGIIKAIYVNDNAYAIRRNSQKGGDIFIINNEKWLVVKELEQWPDWCKVAVKLQVD